MRKNLQKSNQKLFLIDDLSPEDLAMLQALYSRSADSVEKHLEKVEKAGSGKFMSTHYVGYGHKSIGDCGTTTLFIEGVSLLAAKAIQDWPLYCGQETSTRYIDMANQKIIDPVGTPQSARILSRWMEFYTKSQDKVVETVREKYPRKEGEKEEVYERAVKARSFDILRGFLPAGITTQLSWHTNLRQAGDHLSGGLVYHPAAEIRELGLDMLKLLSEAYPSSSQALGSAAVSGVSNKDEAGLGERALWELKASKYLTYSHEPDCESSTLTWDEGLNCFQWTNTWAKVPTDLRELIQTRPRGCVLPRVLLMFGSLTSIFLLDFGSFRDLQRHRNGFCAMPLLTTELGFEPWYLDQLGTLREQASVLIKEQEKEIEEVTSDTVMRQYYIPLGMRVQCTTTEGLPSFVYKLELRTSKTVHPTLRTVMLNLAQQFRENLRYIPIHVDTDPDDWTVRRGQQTITQK